MEREVNENAETALNGVEVQRAPARRARPIHVPDGRTLYLAEHEVMKMMQECGGVDCDTLVKRLRHLEAANEVRLRDGESPLRFLDIHQWFLDQRERDGSATSFADFMRQCHPEMLDLSPKPTVAQPKPIALGHDQKEAQEKQGQDLKPLSEKKHIFISHAGEDAEIADRLANDLRDRGHETIMDKKHLNPGDGIISFMRQGISNAHTIIILYSKQTASATWQQKEIDVAVWNEWAQSGGRCIAVKLDDSPMDPILGSKVYMTLDMSNPAAYEKFLEDLCAVVLPQKTASSTAFEASRPESTNPTP